MSEIKPYALHWFRRDLRLRGNPALMKNLQEYDGRVLGVFFFDSTFLARADFSHNRFGFFLQTLHALREEMRASGGELLVLDCPPVNGFKMLFAKMQERGIDLPTQCSFNRDYEPFARQRDFLIEELLKERFKVKICSMADHLLIEPSELRKSDGGTYQVFTPFYHAWLTLLAQRQVQRRIKGEGALSRISPELFKVKWQDIFAGAVPFVDALDFFIEQTLKKVKVPLPKAGNHAALQCLRNFKLKLANYQQGRDFPAQDHTSGLSIYLKNGSLSMAQIFAYLANEAQAAPFLRQLVWREFYYHILFHHPNVEKEAFLSKFRQLQWQSNPKLFEAWKQGRTGFPLVDAGMRQLLQTGLMHNRVRMVVASFLCKDLLIDWRWGEQWFMQNLLDGDLAVNNGGWQWAASTGCDPQPYFRIFNPVLQSRKFDPQGHYIRQFVPELAHLSDKEIHFPSAAVRQSIYPAPIVDHAQARLAALKLYGA